LRNVRPAGFIGTLNLLLFREGELPSVEERIDEEAESLLRGDPPAEVWGWKSRPISSRSAMTFRMVAGLRLRSDCLATVRDPTGSPLSI
jgi:hypothetical protein